jgi:hypothetical protein
VAETTRRLPVRDGFVVVAELAEYLKADRSNLFRKLKKLGIHTERMAFERFGNQWVSVMSQEDARRYLADRKAGTLRGEAITYLDDV